MKARFRAQRDSVFTKEQKAKLDQMVARRQAEQAKEPRRQCSGN
jgi:hypothetical protein